MISNAKVNSRQTCDGGDVMASCREKHCHIFLTDLKRSVKAFAVKSNAKVHSRHTCGGDVKVSCRESTAKSLDRFMAQRDGYCCEKQSEGKLKTYLTIIGRRVKAYALKGIAMVSSRQTCDGGDVRVSCREKHCHIS